MLTTAMELIIRAPGSLASVLRRARSRAAMAMVVLLCAPLLARAQDQAPDPPSDHSLVTAGEKDEAPPSPYKSVYVLAAGWNTYPKANEAFEDLRFAENDAKELGDLFRQKYGYTIEYLPANCTRKALEDKLAEYQKRVGPDDVFIMHVAAHGTMITVPNPESGADDSLAYLILPGGDLNAPLRAAIETETKRRADGRAKFLESDPGAANLTLEERIKRGMASDLADDAPAIRAAAARSALTREVMDRECIGMLDLRERVMGMPAKHALLMIDACHSGGAIHGTRDSLSLYDDLSDPDVTRYLLLQESSRTVLTAGTVRQKAKEWEGAPYGSHGLFSGSIIDKLKKSEGAVSDNDLYLEVRGDLLQITRSGDESAMAPQRRSSDDEGKHIGEFVFIPAPRDAWLRRVIDAQNTPAAQQLRAELRARAGSARDRSRSDMLLARAITIAPAAAGAGGGVDLAADPRWREWFARNRERALAGDSSAMVSMYHAYAKGLGIAPSPHLAYEWAREAEATGDPDGAEASAAALRDGVGVDPNQRAAAYYKELAAKLAPAGTHENTSITTDADGRITGLGSLRGDPVSEAAAEVYNARLDVQAAVASGQLAGSSRSVAALGAAATKAKKLNKEWPRIDFMSQMLPETCEAIAVDGRSAIDAARSAGGTAPATGPDERLALLWALLLNRETTPPPPGVPWYALVARKSLNAKGSVSTLQTLALGLEESTHCADCAGQGVKTARKEVDREARSAQDRVPGAPRKGPLISSSKKKDVEVECKTCHGDLFGKPETISAKLSAFALKCGNTQVKSDDERKRLESALQEVRDAIVRKGKMTPGFDDEAEKALARGELSEETPVWFSASVEDRCVAPFAEGESVVLLVRGPDGREVAVIDPLLDNTEAGTSRVWVFGVCTSIARTRSGQVLPVIQNALLVIP